jgi:hypothetical protein
MTFQLHILRMKQKQIYRIVLYILLFVMVAVVEKMMHTGQSDSIYKLMTDEK